MAQKVLMRWQASSFFGWGIAGLNVFERWTTTPDIQPLMGLPITPFDYTGTDPLRYSVLQPAITASNQFLEGLTAGKVGLEETILIDAFPHGHVPGTVYVVEPGLSDPAAALSEESFVEPHAMNPVNVLRMATAMKAPLKRVLLVGCEPATFGGEEGQMGLSPAVAAAVGEAMKIVVGLVEKGVERHRRRD